MNIELSEKEVKAILSAFYSEETSNPLFTDEEERLFIDRLRKLVEPVKEEKRRILLVKSAQCWYDGALKLWEGKKHAEAFLALENALNHTENALREEMDRDNKQ